MVAGILGECARGHTQMSALTVLVEDDSPYPEVRSAVANTDDPTIPVSSIRAWVIGMCGPPTENTDS